MATCRVSLNQQQSVRLTVFVSWCRMPCRSPRVERRGSSLMEQWFKVPCLGNNFIIWQQKVSYCISVALKGPISKFIIILLIVLHIFLVVLKGRTCLKRTIVFLWWSFPIFSQPECVVKQWFCKEKLDAGHYWGLQGWYWCCRVSE